ncbi:hypothetical protein MPH_10717 [Macrophomina phaseolina MS6]|uniref:Uncharacterized protein n=1 Tax=Macrophomina phaseolina (strain MS6) TaxID=1126212 RepID=K2RC64_MACPH|nr:hypothetical protein MPH_10717 [Macrophomina phaseolina MS6]
MLYHAQRESRERHVDEESYWCRTCQSLKRFMDCRNVMFMQERRPFSLGFFVLWDDGWGKVENSFSSQGLMETAAGGFWGEEGKYLGGGRPSAYSWFLIAHRYLRIYMR